MLDAIDALLTAKGIRHVYFKKENRISISTGFIKCNVIPHNDGLIINRGIGKKGGYYINYSNPQNNPESLVSFLEVVMSIDEQTKKFLATGCWQKLDDRAF